MDLNFAAQRRVWRYAILLAVIIAASPSAFAQTSPAPASPAAPQPSPTTSLEREFLRNILRDQRAIWTSPFRLRGEDARWLAPLGAGTAALIATDRRTAGELGNGEDRLEVSRGVSETGAFYTASGIASAFYLVGRQTNNARARETGLLGAEALINSCIVVTALKTVTQRSRPRVGSGSGEFFNGGNSFPSGHAVTAWSLATVIAQEYRDRPPVRFGAYGVAAAVSASRFTGRNHFLSDVFVGSAIGYGIGRYVYKTHHDPNIDSVNGGTGARSKLFPMIAPQYDRRARAYGVTLAWNF